MEIVHLYISTGHNYFGHHGKLPSDHATIEVSSLVCLAGHGIRGDRFFDYKDDYKGQVTFFSMEVFEELCAEFHVHQKPPSVLRRNILTRGQDLREFIGRDFDVQEVRFAGVEECRPCYWMDQAFAPGAERFLRGRGGLRARILQDGEIKAGQSVGAAKG